MRKLLLACPAFSFCLLVPAFAQTACPSPAAWMKPASGNLFSEEQEVWLGDAIADLIESKYSVVKDPAQNAYLEKIGTRLALRAPAHQYPIPLCPR